jgi:hypothetical protein
MLSRVGLAARRALLVLPLAGGIASAQTLGDLELRGTGAGFNIVDLTTQSSSINISGFNSPIGRSATNQSVVVRLNGLSHTWVGDLSIRLAFQATPLSEVIGWTMMNRPGIYATQSAFGFNDNLLGSYSFGEGDPDSDSFMGDFNDFWAFTVDGNLPSGDYFAFDEFNGYDSPSKFMGLNPNGTWTLSIGDGVSGDAGALTSWDLAFHVVPEPSSVALMAIGMAALIASARRRRVS